MPSIYETKKLLEKVTADPEAQEMARIREKAERDYISNMRAAEKRGREQGLAEGKAEGRAEGRVEGMAEGRAEGRVEGIAEGRAKGRVEGVAEGRAKARQEIVDETLQRLLSMPPTAGLSDSEIAVLVGVDVARVAVMRKSLRGDDR